MLASQHKRRHIVQSYETKTTLKKKKHKTSPSKAHLTSPNEVQVKSLRTETFLKTCLLAQRTRYKLKLARRGQCDLQTSSNIMEIHF